MEFTPQAFRDTIYERLLNSYMFPYMKDSETDRAKHPKRQPLHLKDAIRNNKMTFDGGENTSGFEIGSDILENTHPYYHILQQAPVIRKAGKGTKKTKGSQANIADKGKRDYEQVSFGGKFGGKLFKEYEKNVRGERNRLNQVSHWKDNNFINKDSNAYINTHYKYIDKILDYIMPIIAIEYRLKMLRKQDSGLTEELAYQWGESEETVIDILNSFKGE